MGKPLSRRTRCVMVGVLALVSVAPARALAAPEGQMTWALHFSLAPTLFEPAETPGVVSPFMILYALVLRPGASAPEGELIDFCRGRLAHFKCPTSIEVRDALTRTATGKLQKFKPRAPRELGACRPGTHAGAAGGAVARVLGFAA